VGSLATGLCAVKSGGWHHFFLSWIFEWESWGIFPAFLLSSLDVWLCLLPASSIGKFLVQLLLLLTASHRPLFHHMWTKDVRHKSLSSSSLQLALGLMANITITISRNDVISSLEIETT
jgi:hypothetical protein